MIIQDNPIALAALVGLIIELLAFLGGLYFFAKRYPLERMTAAADAHSDTATAQLTLAQADAKRLDNQSRMIALLLERDEQLGKLSLKVSSLTAQVGEIEVLKVQLERTNRELDKEREWRIRTEKLLGEERERSETYRLERDELANTVRLLSSRVDELDKLLKNQPQSTQEQ